MSAASFQLLEGDPTTWGVPPVGSTLFGVNLSGVPVMVTNNGSGGAVITPILSAAPSTIPFANAAGNTTLTPSTGVSTAIGTITGTARTVGLVLATADMVDGMELNVLLQFPALDGLVMNFYNTVASGPPLQTFTSTTAGGITTGYWKFIFSGATSLWVPVLSKIPAI